MQSLTQSQLEFVITQIEETLETTFETDGNSFLIEYDEIYDVSIRLSEDGRAIEMVTALGLTDPTMRAAIAETALKLNHKWALPIGARIVAADGGVGLRLECAVAPSEADHEQLATAIARFIEAARSIREDLQAAALATPLPPAETDVDFGRSDIVVWA